MGRKKGKEQSTKWDDHPISINALRKTSWSLNSGCFKKHIVASKQFATKITEKMGERYLVGVGLAGASYEWNLPTPPIHPNRTWKISSANCAMLHQPQKYAASLKLIFVQSGCFTNSRKHAFTGFHAVDRTGQSVLDAETDIGNGACLQGTWPSPFFELLTLRSWKVGYGSFFPRRCPPPQSMVRSNHTEGSWREVNTEPKKPRRIRWGPLC